MILFSGAFGLILFAAWIFGIIDVITTPPEGCRNLPKIVWLILIVLLGPIGAIAWLVAGRDWAGRSPRGRIPAARRPRQRPGNPDDDPEFIESLRRRAEEQRRGGDDDGSSS